MKILTIGKTNFNLDNIVNIEFIDANFNEGAGFSVRVQTDSDDITRCFTPKDFPTKNVNAASAQMAFNLAMRHMREDKVYNIILDNYLPPNLSSLL